MTKINLGDIFDEDESPKQEIKPKVEEPVKESPKPKRKYVRKQLIKENSSMSDIKKEIISSYKPSNSVKSIEKEDNYAQNLLSEVEKDLKEESKKQIKKPKKVIKKHLKSKKKKSKEESKPRIVDSGNIFLFENNIWRFRRCPACESKIKRYRVVKINNFLLQKVKCKNKKCKFEMDYKFDIE